MPQKREYICKCLGEVLERVLELLVVLNGAELWLVAVARQRAEYSQVKVLIAGVDLDEIVRACDHLGLVVDRLQVRKLLVARARLDLAAELYISQQQQPLEYDFE